MKYALIIAGGGGEAIDAPIPDLEGFTPLEAAQTPMLDALGQLGRQGVVSTTPSDAPPGAHAPIATLLGADMSVWPTSRGAMEAIGLSAAFPPGAAVWRLAPVTMDADFATIVDPRPARLTPADTKALVDSLRAALPAHPTLSMFRVVEGAGADATDALLILDDAPPEALSGKVALPAADAMGAPEGWASQSPGKPLIRAFPKGDLGQAIRGVCELSADVFQNHEVNTLRAEHDLPPVSMFWCEGGGGRPPGVAPFAEQFDRRAAIITGDAAAAGVASHFGIDRLPVPGELIGPHADFGAVANHAIEALERYDLVIVHTDALTGASLAGDWRTKAALWERIDEELVTPIHTRLLLEGDSEADTSASGWRLLVACDSVCSTAARVRSSAPAPFVMAGAYIRSVLQSPFADSSAHASDLKIDPGDTLMEYFLYSGLRIARRRTGTVVETHQREA